MLPRILIFLSLAAILGVPFLLRPARPDTAAQGSLTLIIVTPHVQQIRSEFAVAFDRWHRHHHGQGVHIDWRTPGGTSEIVKQLEAQYAAAVKSGRFDFSDPANPVAPAGTIGFDLMFGGGSFDHGRLRTGIRVRDNGEDRRLSMSIPVGFPQSELDAWYGDNYIGAERLYDPDQYWLGTALSSFGIVYNRDVLRRLGLPEPRSFEDLTDPRYIGMIALADPRQSGSITTAFDSILNNEGWESGWRILREMTANTRYFTNSATKPPIDVSAGEAAAALAIDFYGRGQAQSIAHSEDSQPRIGYIDPPGRVYIDADPISILRAGPNPALARRFIEFCLSDEGQALWQFPSLLTNPLAADNPKTDRGERVGPQRHQLRRMPVRREMYERYQAHFIDQVNPFEIASSTTVKGWRAAIGPMMGAFAIDIADDQRAAWAALIQASGNPAFPPDVLTEMRRLFYAWPGHAMPDGTILEFNQANFPAIRETWRNPDILARSRILYTTFFRDNYRQIQHLARQARPVSR